MRTSPVRDLRTPKARSSSGWGSSTGSRASTARLQTSSRSRIGTPMLGGISLPVDIQNDAAAENFERLYTQPEEGTLASDGAQHPVLHQNHNHAEEFDNEVDATMRRIADMQ